MATERIQKILAAAGYGSRRACETLVLDGRVAVNGKYMRELPVLVDPATDKISVDGKPIRPERHVYFLLNKPRNVLCTHNDPSGRRLVEDLLTGVRERVFMGIAARHADIWNNLAIFQPQLGAKIEALRRRCDELDRDFGEIEVSQQCVVVIAETQDAARAALEKARKIYGGHMGGAIEEHGIWGAPDQVIERIERHRALGCGFLPMEFFGRDTREPSPFSYEILNANPYAFLDDAPLEERRARAVATRRTVAPGDLGDLARLDPEAIARVRADAWPVVRDADNKEHTFPAADVDTITPSRVSLMPDGQMAGLTPQEAADLLEFLATRK